MDISPPEDLFIMMVWKKGGIHLPVNQAIRKEPSVKNVRQI